MATDFTMKSQVDPTAIAALAQRQAQEQAQMDQQASQQKMKMIQEIAQGVSGMVSNSIEASKQRQNEDFLKKYAASQVPNQTLPQQGPRLPNAQGQETALPAVSTPDYMGQNAAKAAVAMNPAQFAKDLSTTLTQTPEQKAITTMNLQKSRLEAANAEKIGGAVQPSTMTLLQNLYQKNNIPFDPAAYANSTDQQAMEHVKALGTAAKPDQNAAITLDDAYANDPDKIRLAHQLIEGKGLPFTYTNSRGAEKEKLSMLAARIDPTWDPSVVPQRIALRKDFATGNSARNLTSLNTVIGHLDTMTRAFDKLNNAEVTKYNSVGNYLAKNTGKPEVDAFNAAKTVVNGELAKVVQGVGVVTNEERASFDKNLNDASSPAQAKAVVEKYMDLMKSRTDALKENWSQSMGDTATPVPIINAKSKAILAKHGYDPKTLEKVDASTASGGKFVALDGGFSYRVK